MPRGDDPKDEPCRTDDPPDDFEERDPEEVHSDPVLWWEIQNDPAIWPENKAAAYRAALRGEREWWFATSDDPTAGDDEPVRPPIIGREIP